MDVPCYKTLIRPLLEYGCVVWDPHQKNDIEELEKYKKEQVGLPQGTTVMKQVIQKSTCVS